MKKLFGIIVLTCLLSGSFAACNNDGADLPDYNDLMFNKQDREAYFEVLKAAYGPYLEDLLSSLNASLDNPKSYPGAVWAYVEGSLEKRIVTIVLKNLFEETGQITSEDWPSETYGHISPAIWDCEYLTTLGISSEMFHGDMPPCGDGGKNFKCLYLFNTNITSLPLDLFMLPTMTALFGTGNKALKHLPEGMGSVPYKHVDWYLLEGGLTGTVPAEIDIPIDLSYNEYTSVDWEDWKKIDVISRIRLHPDSEGTYYVSAPRLKRNKISGIIPEEILTDTLKLIYTYDRIHPQLSGYGFANMPPTAEVFKMKNEYMKNHPDVADAVKYMRPFYDYDQPWDL